MSGPGEDSGSGLQFDRAEFAGSAGAGAGASQPCALCHRPIADGYYEIAGRVACPDCRVKVGGALEGGDAGTQALGALLWGGGAAVLGALVWYLIIKVTDSNLGIVAVGVGWLVGKGVARGSKNRGGLRYQALAAFLAYGAIALALFPFLLQGLAQHGASPAPHPPAGPLTAGALVAALGGLAAVAFTVPFIAGTSSPLSGLIFAFALWEAWKLNRRVPIAISGPFSRLAVAAPVPVAAGVPPTGPAGA